MRSNFDKTKYSEVINELNNLTGLQWECDIEFFGEWDDVESNGQVYIYTKIIAETKVKNQRFALLPTTLDEGNATLLTETLAKSDIYINLNFSKRPGFMGNPSGSESGCILYANANHFENAFNALNGKNNKAVITSTKEDARIALTNLWNELRAESKSAFFFNKERKRKKIAALGKILTHFDSPELAESIKEVKTNSDVVKGFQFGLFKIKKSRTEECIELLEKAFSQSH